MTFVPPKVVTELPGPRARALLAEDDFDIQGLYRTVVLDEDASHDTTLVDIDGNAYLDLFSSFALGALGYNHPAVLAVARSDAFARAAATPTSTPFLTSPAWFAFLDRLKLGGAPKGLTKGFFVDGGGEGVESAIKTAFLHFGERARVAAGRPRNPLELPADEQRAFVENVGVDAVLISFEGAFHGRSLGALSATRSKVIHKADQPAFPWPMVPFPANRFPLRDHADENEVLEAQALQALDRVLDAYAGRVAGLIVEPVQSEGGDRHASAAFFRAVQARVKAAGGAFILDEVQTGTGTSGKLWCHEHFDLPHPPDMVTFGKKMQLGGYFSTEEYAIRQFGRMYQTRNGDRSRAMLATAILDTIVADDLLQNVASTGMIFLEGLESLSKRHPMVTEPRGRGFLLAFDLPTPAVRDDFLKRCLRRGVFAGYTGTRSVRLRPHLITGPAEARFALDTFDQVLAEMHA